MAANGADHERLQPEFALGERLAKLEAESSRVAEDRQNIQGQIGHRLADAEKLFDEKLDGLSERLTAINEAQKEAVDKAEKATANRFDTFVEQNDRKSEVTGDRLQALERGESAGTGSKAGFNSAWGTVVIVITILISLGTLIAIFLSSHP